jgi:hypothetical protein
MLHTPTNHNPPPTIQLESGRDAAGSDGSVRLRRSRDTDPIARLDRPAGSLEEGRLARDRIRRPDAQYERRTAAADALDRPGQEHLGSGRWWCTARAGMNTARIRARARHRTAIWRLARWNAVPASNGDRASIRADGHAASGGGDVAAAGDLGHAAIGRRWRRRREAACIRRIVAGGTHDRDGNRRGAKDSRHHRHHLDRSGRGIWLFQ